MMKQQYRLWVIGAVAIFLVAAVAFTGKNSANAEQTLALEAPAFVRASADESTISNIGTFLSSEAGISAYIQTVNPIDLSQVRGEFRTIETETANYIIGSVAVPNHPEHFDVHVYVHTDGWILAYYLNDEATAKIVDVLSATISSTKLETVISIIAGALGESTTGLRYYDFRFPNATKILMVAEDSVDGRDFNIEMPTEYGYSERSFAVYNTYYDSGSWKFYVNGEAMTRSWYGSNMAYGQISAAQLPAGQSHQVRLDSGGNGYGFLVITYRVP